MTSSIRKRKGLDVFLSSHQTKIKYYICLKLLKQLRTWELVGFYHWTSCKRGHRENSIRFSTFTHWGQIRLTNKTVWGTVSNISRVKHCTWSTQEILLSPNDSDYCLTQTIHCCLLTFPAEHIKGIFSLSQHDRRGCCWTRWVVMHNTVLNPLLHFPTWTFSTEGRERKRSESEKKEKRNAPRKSQ